ncbi:hypothetical protein F5J12DRAFT_503144 [Pisolithus orientalis]|uniref:uncharacterized protein n=1 Tax=Pisolithus orientalis TaxID=936130 RepID=UPI0022251B8B|nr:uncharacterized protein F5J12DRAFT_77054 [Pisolithus orientalis]XP_051595058.1 uncharacterized protein F5J12DRAFT_503144 [Pisolithus orientalis]KAI5984575.1 hypothetical protein F5J12DRAFT_77054 [Pisolithus orientalis]KAI5989630.1 hypothetical protein F5J12DRAFT_503144 [Pisolithus orientalis]
MAFVTILFSVQTASTHVQVRSHFAQVPQTRGFQHAQASVIIKASIDILIRHFSLQSRWCGSSAALAQENLGVSLLYVLADRWISAIECVPSVASDSYLIGNVALLHCNIQCSRSERGAPEVHLPSLDHSIRTSIWNYQQT